MDNLKFFIDSHYELVDFGYIVHQKMLAYEADATSESCLLPYPALITHFLESHDVIPQDDEDIAMTRRYLPSPMLNTLPNDFKEKIHATGEAHVKEIKGLSLGHNAKIQQAIESLMNAKRAIGQVLDKLPKTFAPSDVEDEDVGFHSSHEFSMDA